jgi:5,10-methylene-tetrahydrofolate dehydrogenase/methenyl tetrahydrofolate cyclohydrolase
MTKDKKSKKILSGKKISAQLRKEIAKKVSQRAKQNLPIPGLATILIGDDPASQVYVKSKHKACQELGINSFSFEESANLSQDKLLDLIHELNQRSDVHGILVQLPIPKHIDESVVIESISPKKYVDGLHPVNAGLLAQKGRTSYFSPATPSGIMHLLEIASIKLEGADAVVLGRSNIVGVPIAAMLLEANATVTICHSRSQNLAEICSRADILIAAVGKAQMVKANWVKDGAVVIDVGVNRVNDESKKRGYRLLGDVAFEEVEKKASLITPVPGGVGPMTIAMLMKNTLHAAQLADSEN